MLDLCCCLCQVNSISDILMTEAIIQGIYSFVKKGFRVLVFNATFKNISVISWWSVVLVVKKVVLGSANERNKFSVKPAVCCV